MGIRTHSPRPPQPRHRKKPPAYHGPGTVRNPAHQSTTLTPRPPQLNSKEKMSEERGVT